MSILATGLPGVFSAFAKGAPIRIIANECTGASEFWYVRADSKFQSLKDPDISTMVFSTIGSSTHGLAKGLASHFGLKAQLVATGAVGNAHAGHVQADRRRLDLAAPRYQGD